MFYTTSLITTVPNPVPSIIQSKKSDEIRRKFQKAGPPEFQNHNTKRAFAGIAYKAK